MFSFVSVYLPTGEEGGPCTGPPFLGPYCTALLPDMFKFLHYVVCTVSKPAVGIQLKCLLVYQWKCQTQEENIEGSFYREEKYPNWLKGARDFKNNSKGVSTLENYSRKWTNLRENQSIEFEQWTSNILTFQLISWCAWNPSGYLSLSNNQSWCVETFHLLFLCNNLLLLFSVGGRRIWTWD